MYLSNTVTCQNIYIRRQKIKLFLLPFQVEGEGMTPVLVRAAEIDTGEVSRHGVQLPQITILTMLTIEGSALVC